MSSKFRVLTNGMQPRIGRLGGPGGRCLREKNRWIMHNRIKEIRNTRKAIFKKMIFLS